MQYSATSFAQPLVDLLGSVLLLSRSKPTFKEYFPPPGTRAETRSADLTVEVGYRPAWQVINWSLRWFLHLQNGRVQLYVLYIVLTLLVLLIALLGT
jgi:hypothetical protein